MKSLIFSMLLMVSFTITKAQITILEADLPSIGDTVYRQTALNISGSIDPLKSNQNDTWDLSWLISDAEDTVIFLDPKSTSLGDSFPSANILQIDNENDFYIEKDQNGFNVIGVRRFDLLDNDGYLHAEMDPNLTIMKTPSTLNDQFNSTGNFIFIREDTLFGSYFYIEVHATITRDVEFTKYGTLKMPNDSVYEVIVAEVNEIKTDSTISDIAGNKTTQSNTEKTLIYEFYTKGLSLPLARVEYNDDKDEVISIQYVDQLKKVDIVTSLKASELQAVFLYPNPTNDVLTVKSAIAVESISIFDLQGKMLLKELNTKQINLQKLEKGTYISKVKLLNGSVINKQIIKN